MKRKRFIFRHPGRSWREDNIFDRCIKMREKLREGKNLTKKDRDFLARSKAAFPARPDGNKAIEFHCDQVYVEEEFILRLRKEGKI